MKRLFSFLFLIPLVSAVLTVQAMAADAALVTDGAGLLTEAEYKELNTLADVIAEEYQCEVAVVTADSIGGADAYDFAVGVFEEYNFGFGDDKSGLLLLVSMEERDYALIAHGYGNTAFTDYGKDKLLGEHVLPLLGEDDYYRAFKAYLDTSAAYLAMAGDGVPFDVDTDPEGDTAGFLIKLGIAILLPLVTAGIVCGVWYGQMKTAKPARAADRYIPADGFVLTRREDRFLYRTETRRKIEQVSSSGGGTSIGSGGYSGRSGKF